jgi:hypothetical protein
MPKPRRIRRTLALAVLLTAVLVVPLGGAATAAGGLTGAAARLVELLNAERREAGLPALRVLPRLSRMAAAHSRVMGGDSAPCGPPHLHHNPDLGSQVQPAQAWGENVACAGDAGEMHQALMDSPGHRENILSPRWNAVGAGTYDGRLLWGTQVFAKVSGSELAEAAAPVAEPPTATTRKRRAAPATEDPEPAPTTTKPEPKAPAPTPERIWPRVERALERMCRLPSLFGPDDRAQAHLVPAPAIGTGSGLATTEDGG